MFALLRWTKIVVAWVGFVCVPPVVGLAAFFGSAKLTATIGALVAAALLASALVAYGLARLALAASGSPNRPRRAALASAAAVTLIAAVGGRILFLRPSFEAVEMPQRKVVFEQVPLETGSKVAVARLPAASKQSGRSPLVFLHGGPGAFVRDSDLELLGSIAERGFDVVTYDQAGGGASDRLDVRDYSVARAVADLDALRIHLGSERVSLLGQSWGAVLAYEYASTHPENVDKIIIASGGMMDRADAKFSLDRTAARGNGPEFPAYFMATAFLFRLNPDAALAFTPRDELDATWRRAAAGNLGRWYCKDDEASVPPPSYMESLPAFDGYQGFALKLDLESRGAGEAPASPPPTLMLRGECDFVPWSAARAMRDNLSATLVTIPGVGHAIWPAKSDLVVDLTIAHLEGRALPAPAYEGQEDPAATSSR